MSNFKSKLGIGIVIGGLVAIIGYVAYQDHATKQAAWVAEAKSQVDAESSAMQALRTMHDQAAKNIATKLDVSFAQGESQRDNAVEALGGPDWQIIFRDYAQHKVERDTELQALKQQLPATPTALEREAQIMRAEREELTHLWYPGLKGDDTARLTDQNDIVGLYAWILNTVSNYQVRFSDYTNSAPNLPAADKQNLKTKFGRFCADELRKVRKACQLPTTETVTVASANGCANEVFKQLQTSETEVKDKNNEYVAQYNNEQIRQSNEQILRALFDAAAQQQR